MSRRRRRKKRSKTIHCTPRGYSVYENGDGQGPPYRPAVEEAIRRTGLQGAAFEAVIEHEDSCLGLTGLPMCTCRCTFAELLVIGESPDSSFNVIRVSHVSKNRN